MLQKQIRSSNEFTKEDLLEIERVIELIDEIERNLKPLKITLYSLLIQLGKTRSSVSLNELELINKNIIENNQGLTSKWEITNLSSNIFDDSISPKM